MGLAAAVPGRAHPIERLSVRVKPRFVHLHDPGQTHHVHLEESVPGRLVDGAAVRQRSAVVLVVVLLESSEGVAGLVTVDAVDLPRIAVEPVADVGQPLENELVVAHHVFLLADRSPIVLLALYHRPHILGAQG
jgi:hypothetical protein